MKNCLFALLIGLNLALLLPDALSAGFSDLAIRARILGDKARKAGKLHDAVSWYKKGSQHGDPVR